jgi:hypothetical protein
MELVARFGAITFPARLKSEDEGGTPRTYMVEVLIFH